MTDAHNHYFRPVRRVDVRPCCLCSKGVAHAGVPLFLRGAMQSMGLDGRAIQREHGLEQMLGGGQAGAALASVMGSDPEIAVPLTAPIEFWVCQPCALKPIPLLMLLETVQALVSPLARDPSRG